MVLVIPHPTDFGSWVPVTLGILTINQIINVITKSEYVTLTEDALGAFETLKKSCLEAPVPSFADFNKLIPPRN